MLLRSKLFYCLWLPSNPMLGGGDLGAILRVLVVWTLNDASQKLFYCLWLPSNPMLGRGDLNTMLGFLVVWALNAALQQTLLLSPAPHPIQY